MSVKRANLVNPTQPDVVIDHGNGSYTLVEGKTQRSGKRVRVRVGGVYVTGDRASAAQVKVSVATSSDMLQRLGDKIARPGVALKTARNVPLFSIDPENPGRFLRKLNGKVERGILENGVFKVVD